MEKKEAKKTSQIIRKQYYITEKSGDTDRTPKSSILYKIPYKRTGECGDYPQKRLGDTLKREYIKEKLKEEEKIKNDAPKRAIDEVIESIRIAARKNLNLKDKRRKELHLNVDPKLNVTQKETVTDKTEVRNDTTKKKKTTETTSTKRENYTQVGIADHLKTAKEPASTTKKPMIRTLVSKKDTLKVYKAVTFVDNKRKPALQISIPNENTNKRNVSTKATYANMPELPTEKSKKAWKPKKKRISRNVSSPTLPCRKMSPPTEVAKWAPACLSQHTKPYYEAWVNTTLTAVSRQSKANKLLIKKYIMQSMKMDGEQSPEPEYENIANLSRVGTIKVTQR